MSNHIHVIFAPDGRVAIDIDLPPGERCDDLATSIPALLAMLGAPLEGIIETGDHPPQPNGVPDGLPLKVGGGR